jgi:hypothetical protein
MTSSSLVRISKLVKYSSSRSSGLHEEFGIDEDITMLDAPEIWSSMSYKSSPTWSSRRFGLSWPPKRTLISPSYNVEMRHSLMHWKEDNESFLWFWSELQKVHGSFYVTTIRCCVTYFGPSRSCIVSGLKPKLRTPPPNRPQPVGVLPPRPPRDTLRRW